MAERTSTDGSLLSGLLSVDDIRTWIEPVVGWARQNLLSVDVGLQIGLVCGALVPALLIGPACRKYVNTLIARHDPQGIMLRLANACADLATPFALYLMLTAMRVALGSADYPINWIAATLSLLSAWIVVRVVTLVIQSRFWSRVALYIAWPVAALDAFGALGPVVEQMRALAIPIGENADGAPIDISLFDVVRTLFYFTILFWGASFIGRIVEQRIQLVEDLNPSLRALIVKILNVVLPVIALLIALQIVGFNLATLAVFSGAVGLGVGLGLQRIAANFIAGFTLIADRSIKPHDIIEIDGTFGWVTAMQARYVALRTRDGTEILIPNDRFMSEGVVNWSRTDREVRIHAPFGVSYKTRDLKLVQKLAIDAARSVERVLERPAPVCHLIAYGESSVDFDLRFWIDDPQNGKANVRSDVMLVLWDRLHENDIEIPFPQRDLHVRTWEAPVPGSGAESA
ncbi:MAG: mechanosensitive ion channel [Gammaproteobacteria bacterium]|nr:mechanosensitive ion channel [Gammaproteobacteria bacterium]